MENLTLALFGEIFCEQSGAGGIDGSWSPCTCPGIYPPGSSSSSSLEHL